jgi:hypothetical protein
MNSNALPNQRLLPPETPISCADRKRWLFSKFQMPNRTNRYAQA